MTGLPFPLDTTMTRLARSYLSVAAKRPQSKFSTGDPVAFIDRLALDYLTTHCLITWVDCCFQATSAGVVAHQQFLEAGR